MRKENDCKIMFIGVVWNFVAQLKLVLSSLLFICSLVTLLQFFPSSINNLHGRATFLSPSLVTQPVEKKKLEDVVNGSLIKRNFDVYGSAAYNFILMSAYRGGADTFAVIGLSLKPLYLFAKPSYFCEWVPHNGTVSNENVNVTGYKILPDWGYGRVYTVVVVNCTFPVNVGGDGTGGQLLVHASTAGGLDASVELTDTIEAFTESPGDVSSLMFAATPKYEYLYCGSPLYGGLSPQRVRVFEDVNLIV